MDRIKTPILLRKWGFFICSHPAIKYLALIVILSLSACAGKPMVWPADPIARSPHVRSTLLDRNSKAYATVETEQIQKINNAKIRISNVTGTYSPLLLVEGKDPNAFAFIVQGKRAIGVNIGMLDLLGNDYDAFAFVIGHEMAHHVRGHGETRENRKSILDAVGIVLGIALNVAGVPAGGIITDLGVDVIHTSYTRDEEREADACGLQYMIDAEFDPQGAIRLQQKLMEASSNFHIPFLSTHPATAERIENLRALIEKKGAVSGTPEKEQIEIAKPSPGGESVLSVSGIDGADRNGRFIAKNDGTVLDTQTGLMWAAMDNGQDISWQDAKEYCENYRGGGYTDWRMPTQYELANLCDNKGKNLNELRLTTSINVSGCCPWTSENRVSEAVLFNFDYGYGYGLYHSFSHRCRALPIRSGNDK